MSSGNKFYRFQRITPPSAHSAPMGRTIEVNFRPFIVCHPQITTQTPQTPGLRANPFVSRMWAGVFIAWPLFGFFSVGFRAWFVRHHNHDNWLFIFHTIRLWQLRDGFYAKQTKIVTEIIYGWKDFRFVSPLGQGWPAAQCWIWVLKLRRWCYCGKLLGRLGNHFANEVKCFEETFPTGS